MAALWPLTIIKFQVHLISTNPPAYVEDFVRAGDKLITVHAENGPLTPAALQKIRQHKAGAGLTLGLPTRILKFFNHCDPRGLAEGLHRLPGPVFDVN